MTLLENPTAHGPSLGSRYHPWSSGSGAVQCAATVPGAATLVEVLAATVTRYPDAPALDDGGRVLSYRDLDLAVRKPRGSPPQA